MSLLCLTGNISAQTNVLSRNVVQSYLTNSTWKFIPGSQITHAQYSIVDTNWIYQLFIPKWIKHKSKIHLKYDRNTTNCETFAFQARYLSQTMGKTNVCVGVFFYLRDDRKDLNDGHAINIILINDNSTLKAVFFEPQLDCLVVLSEKEIKSCYFLYF